MNLKRTLLIFTFFISLYAYSQEKTYDKDFYLIDELDLETVSEYDIYHIDSMLNIFHKETEDTTKIAQLVMIINYVNDLEICKKYNDVIFEKSAQALGKTKNQKVKDRLTQLQGFYYDNLGYFSDVNGDIKTALMNYEKAYEYFNTGNKDLLGIATAATQMGRIYQIMGNTNLALELYKEGAEASKIIGFDYMIAAIYDNIGGILMKEKSYKESRDFFKDALEISREIGDHIGLGRRMSSLAELAIIEENYEQALIYCDSAIVEFEMVDFLQDVGVTKITKSKVYEKQNNLELALQNANEAYEISESIDFYELKLLSLNRLTSVELAQNNYQKAKLHAEKANLLLYTDQHDQGAIETKELMISTYEKLGLIDKAFAEQKLLIILKDSVFSDSKKDEIIRFTHEHYYSQQKDADDLINSQKLELAEEQKQNTRMAMLGAFLIALITAISAFLIFNRLKVIRKQKVKLNEAYGLLEESKKNELAVSNLKALQSQMNPHFIFNALNSVQDLVLLKDIRSSNKFLGKFSDLIRKILLSSKNQFISLEEEVEILSLYLDLEKLRFGEEFHIDFSCDISEEKQEEIQLPAMFIQPYVENAIKHGLFSKKGEKRLKVAFKMIDDHTLECIVQDNGIGQQKAAILKEQRLHLHTGFSTEAINERIRLLNQTLDKKILLNIEDLTDGEHALGTKITLLFPV